MCPVLAAPLGKLFAPPKLQFSLRSGAIPFSPRSQPERSFEAPAESSAQSAAVSPRKVAEKDAGARKGREGGNFLARASQDTETGGGKRRRRSPVSDAE